jgi:hypothetical protein
MIVKLTTDYDELEYPVPDVPTRKPYFPLDAPVKEITSKEVPVKVPRFETNLDDNKVKLNEIGFKSKIKDHKVVKEPVEEKIQTTNVRQIDVTNDSATNATDENDFDFNDFLLYGSAANSDKKECSCPCKHDHHSNEDENKINSDSTPKSPMMVMVVNGQTTIEGSTYFPVRHDEGNTPNPTVPTTIQPDIAEAVDLSDDPPRFFQVNVVKGRPKMTSHNRFSDFCPVGFSTHLRLHL